MKVVCWIVLFTCVGTAFAQSAAPESKTAVRTLSPFMEEVQRRAFRFFWEEADPTTGLVQDRARNFEADIHTVASMAATGDGLAALCIGVERGWITREQGRERALATLRFAGSQMPRRKGIWHHFVQMDTGAQAWNSEWSTIDTALFLLGALTAGQYFGGEVKERADRLYHDVDWVYWSPRGMISHGSRGEIGQPDEFLRNDYGGFDESLFMYVLAIGSPTHPIPAQRWHEFRRPLGRYGPYSSIKAGPLFWHHYVNDFVDLRNRNDGYVDYVEMARTATLANRRFCMDHAYQFKTYGPDSWGLTAGDGPDGYRGYAAPPGHNRSDGTVNPHAAGGSFFVTPVETERALFWMKQMLGDKVWGKYGHSDGYNLDRDWFARDVIGIDTGATLLGIENHRSGLIWKHFMSHPDIQRAMRLIGFRPTPKSAAKPLRLTSLIMAPKAGQPFHYTIHLSLPNRPSWAEGPVYLYGGVAESDLIVSLNGQRLGQLSVSPDAARSPAFRVPASALKWGQRNRVDVRLGSPGEERTAAYGPVHIGPRPALEFKPLAIEVVPAAR